MATRLLDPLRRPNPQSAPELRIVSARREHLERAVQLPHLEHQATMLVSRRRPEPTRRAPSETPSRPRSEPEGAGAGCAGSRSLSGPR